MVNIINDYGKISITSEVFTYLAGDAATSCFGVKGMAGRSKEGGPLQLLRRESMSKGVEVKSTMTAACPWSCTSVWITA